MNGTPHCFFMLSVLCCGHMGMSFMHISVSSGAVEFSWPLCGHFGISMWCETLSFLLNTKTSQFSTSRSLVQGAVERGDVAELNKQRLLFAVIPASQRVADSCRFCASSNSLNSPCILTASTWLLLPFVVVVPCFCSSCSFFCTLNDI